MSLRSSLTFCYLFYRTCNTLEEFQLALQEVMPPVPCHREEPLVPERKPCQEEDPLARWTPPNLQEGGLRMDRAVVVLVSKIFFFYFLFRILIAGMNYFFFYMSSFSVDLVFQSHDFNSFLLLMSYLVHFMVLNTSLTNASRDSTTCIDYMSNLYRWVTIPLRVLETISHFLKYVSIMSTNIFWHMDFIISTTHYRSFWNSQVVRIMDIIDM